MQENLVIVESPAKAKTIEKFLGKDFMVKSSFGHIRDLSKKDLGINLADGFAPVYEIPKDKRKVLTSHDAFGYFSRAYGVTFMAPQGLSSESEASAAQVAEIINQIKADGVKTWFMENQLDPRLVKQIASATGAQPGGELYPEALSSKGGVADTYVKAFRHNVDTIANSMK